jgi:hypothetical protein
MTLNSERKVKTDEFVGTASQMGINYSIRAARHNTTGVHQSIASVLE